MNEVEKGEIFKGVERMKRNYIHSAFLHYLEEQQGSDYIKEQEYNKCSFEHLKQFEEDHYRDFCVEFIENNLKGGKL